MAIIYELCSNCDSDLDPHNESEYAHLCKSCARIYDLRLREQTERLEQARREEEEEIEREREQRQRAQQRSDY